MLFSPVSAPRRLCTPSSLLLMASLLLVAPYACAGSYTVTYSGGTFSDSGDKNEYTESYSVSSANSPAGSYGDSGGDTANYYGDDTPADVGGSGEITATFTWQPGYPGEQPPSCAILQQNSDVFAGSDGMGTGSLDDGLGDTASVTEPGDNELTKTQYSIKTNPGSTFLVKCSPSADSGGAFADVDAKVGYTAAAYPVTVNLIGGIGSSTNKNLLIGQQLGATLSSGPLTQTTWSWSVSGGTPFKNWTASVSNATYTPLGSETGSQLICYFSHPDSASVSCSAHLAVPSGASPAGGLDVTATQMLMVEKPSAQLDISIGAVTDLPTSTNPSVVQLQQNYEYPPSGAAAGITWLGMIATPADYVSSGNYGMWNWTQLVTNQRQQKNNGVYWQFAVKTTTPATIINGWCVLDGTYPYANFWYTADGSQAGNGDSPDQGLDQNPTIREYDVSDSFNDYLMYQPPGSGSLPVPLKLTDWYWEFQALKDASDNWSTSGENAQWGFVSDFPAFPTWTFCATIGQLGYVAPQGQ